MAPVNSGFHARKIFFSGNYPKFGQTPSQIFSSPVLGRKIVKNIGLKGHNIISLPGAPKGLGSALEMACIYRVSQEECGRLREGVPYVKVYRYNPKHLCPKLNGYGDNGHRILKL